MAYRHMRQSAVSAGRLGGLITEITWKAGIYPDLYETGDALLAVASTELHETAGKLKAVESTLREKKGLQKQLLAYIKTKPARDGLSVQKTEKARRAYREQHESGSGRVRLPYRRRTVSLLKGAV